MNFIFILICSFLFIQNSRESLPENVEFLELSEIFKDKIYNIGNKLSHTYQKFHIESKLLNNDGFMNKTTSRMFSLNKSNQRSKGKSAKEKSKYHRKYHRNRNG
jgi:hypothetical protein